MEREVRAGSLKNLSKLLQVENKKCMKVPALPLRSKYPLQKRPAVGHGSSPLSERSSSDSEPPTKQNLIESQLTKILQEVQKANTQLDSYDDKLDSLQERLEKLEEKPTSSSVSSSDASVTKRKVPPEVRVRTLLHLE